MNDSKVAASTTSPSVRVAPTGPVWADPTIKAAFVAFVVVLAGYVSTLAPTVTFWDAGEFLAASKTLGIPHPPGTPVFVFMANVWAKLIPFGGYAFKVNLMTAFFSASAAGFLFLLVAKTLLKQIDDKPFAYIAASAAVITSAFTFTVWQNSNESEVYMVSAFSIAASAWISWLWRENRGTKRAAHLLLLMVYLAAFSIGNHLLTLLVGPAVIGFMAHVMIHAPLANEAERRVEWGQWVVLASTWALLIGTGLGSTTLMTLSLVAFTAAAVYAITVGGGALFPISTLLVGAVGVSTYLFLYIRAGLNPIINEADPSTWDSLLAVIRREQYPPRSPFDDPTIASGPDNPGRTLRIINLQIQNYLQYFDWQWSNSLKTTYSVFAPVRLPFTLLFTSLGIFGATILRQRDRAVFWLVLLTFLITGPGLMAYMNFKPGFAIGFNYFPDPANHEVRERDYFFTVSFQIWGLLAGLGVAGVYKLVRDSLRDKVASAHLAAAPVLLLALIPFVLNFQAASRKHGPEAELARDFAYDLLQSVEPYGILFTNGDNDTFPLWYAQEVEGIRADVTVVNLSLGNTDWYIRQLRDNPVRQFDPEQAPWFAPLAPDTPPGPLHSLSDADIARIRPQIMSSDLPIQIGRIGHTIPAGTPLLVKDVLILRLIQENLGDRPIYFSTTAGSGNWVGLQNYLVQEGLAIKLYALENPDLSRLGAGLFSTVPVDIPRTDSLVWDIYRYAGLLDVDTLDLEPTSQNVAQNLSLPALTLYNAYYQLGDSEGCLRNLRRAAQLTPTEDLRRMVQEAETSGCVPRPVPPTDTPPDSQ